MRNSYDEKIYYDLNGNIKNLERNGETDTSTSVIEIDDLVYTYDTVIKDRLVKVTDTANHSKGFKDSDDNTVNDYTYDGFGNMLTDRNKGITSITYNQLNLPAEIIFNGSTTTKINYIYTADGVKLSKKVTNGSVVTTTVYLDGYQYVNTVLDFFPTPEGYVKATKNFNRYIYSYIFNYKDHLGNNRVSYTVDPADGVLKILEENHYYPFGLKHNGYSPTQQMMRETNVAPFVVLTPVINPADATYKYKFQGQERQDELGLNWDSFKYRNYDSAIGRFMSIDPLAEKYVYNGVYNFAENKVIDHVELEGLEGLHHTLINNGKKSHLIEKNIIFLRQIPKNIPSSATPKEVEEITRMNNEISNSETVRFSEIKDELAIKFGGTHQNSQGEEVSFKFNFTELEVDDTKVKNNKVQGMGRHQFATRNGLEGVNGKVAPAAFVTDDLAYGTEVGRAFGPKLFRNNSGAPFGTSSHEILHTLGLPDNGYNKGGLLNSPPQGLNQKEVDQILEYSIPSKN